MTQYINPIDDKTMGAISGETQNKTAGDFADRIMRLRELRSNEKTAELQRQTMTAELKEFTTNQPQRLALEKEKIAGELELLPEQIRVKGLELAVQGYEAKAQKYAYALSTIATASGPKHRKSVIDKLEPELRERMGDEAFQELRSGDRNTQFDILLTQYEALPEVMTEIAKKYRLDNMAAASGAGSNLSNVAIDSTAVKEHLSSMLGENSSSFAGAVSAVEDISNMVKNGEINTTLNTTEALGLTKKWLEEGKVGWTEGWGDGKSDDETRTEYLQTQKSIFDSQIAAGNYIQVAQIRYPDIPKETLNAMYKTMRNNPNNKNHSDAKLWEALMIKIGNDMGERQQ